MVGKASNSISSGLWAGALLLLACSCVWAAEPMTYAPNGDWIWLGGKRGRPEVHIEVESNILRIGDIGRKHLTQYEIRKAGQCFMRVLKPAGPDGEYDRRTGMSFSRVTDDVFVMTAGCSFGGVFVRKGVPFAPFKRTQPSGRWALVLDDEERIVYDFDRNIMQKIYKDDVREEKFTTFPATFSFPEDFSFSEEYSFPEGVFFSREFAFKKEVPLREGSLVVRSESERDMVLEQISDDVLLWYEDRDPEYPYFGMGRE